jgi:hypothetical protein
MADEGTLRELEQAGVSRLDGAFVAGMAKADVADYVLPFPREIDVRPVAGLIDEVTNRYTAKDRAQSDRWLGPRLHAALRLTRREAARRGVWRYLGVVVFDDYVRWRFKGDKEDPDSPPGLDRFVGPDYKHALARLWWMAELFRNGPDYQPAVKALANQDVINNLFRMDVAHHRPTALGAIAVLSPDGDDDERTGREANALAKAINTTAATIVVDVRAPDIPLDDAARRDWVEEGRDYDPIAFLDELPAGPNDPPVPDSSVEEMSTLLETLLDEAPVRGRPEQPSEPIVA